jgi:predicted methyltransferase
MASPSVHHTAVSGFNRDANKYDKATSVPTTMPFPDDFFANSYCPPRRYDKARPSYPAEAVASVIEQCHVDPATAVVVDLACGTGKFTRVLRPLLCCRYGRCEMVTYRPFTSVFVENSGFKNIIGVEPVADMRRVFSENFPGL